jgi:hypothetical protein
MSVTIDALTQNIELTRGDTFCFTLRDKSTGLPMVFNVADKIIMSIRKFPADADTVFYKEFTPDAEFHILVEILPGDTQELDVGTYYYDLQLSKYTNQIITLIPTTNNTSILPKFKICQDVTRPVEV